jgi:hypothetical protein
MKTCDKCGKLPEPGELLNDVWNIAKSGGITRQTLCGDCARAYMVGRQGLFIKGGAPAAAGAATPAGSNVAARNPEIARTVPTAGGLRPLTSVSAMPKANVLPTAATKTVADKARRANVNKKWWQFWK